MSLPMPGHRTKATLEAVAGTVLCAALVPSFWQERVSPIWTALAATAFAGIIALEGWRSHKRRLVIAVGADLALVFLYLWSLDESLPVGVQATAHGYVVTVGRIEAHLSVPLAPGRVGFYAGDIQDYQVKPTGDAPMPLLANPLARVGERMRLSVPKAAWGDVRLVVDSRPVSLHLSSKGWGLNRRGELEGKPGSSLWLATVPKDDYLLSTELERGDGPQGILLGIDRAGHGYLLTVVADQGKSLLLRWNNGPGDIVAFAPFDLQLAPAIQRDLRSVLPSVMVALLLILLAVPVQTLFRLTARIMPALPDRRMPPNRLTPSTVCDVAAVLAAVVGTGAALWVATWVFRQVPNIQDAVAYLFQAKIFAHGDIWAPAPKLSSFFTQDAIPVYHGRWFGKYPPGWPLLLAAGVRLHMPWVVNPVLMGLTLLLIYRIGRQVYDPGVALTATLLALSSPFLLLLSGSYMAHTATLFFLCGFAYLVVRWKTQSTAPSRLGGARLLVPAGVLFGMALITRPLDAIAFALPFGALVLRRPLSMVWFGLGTTGPSLPGLLFDRAVTGSFLGNPFMLSRSWDHIGFGRGIGGGPHPRGHSLVQGLWNMASDVYLLQAHLFGWPFYVTLALAAIPFVLGRANRWDVLFTASALCVIGAYVSYFNPGHFYGPRYYYVTAAWFALLSARGLEELYLLGRYLPFGAARPGRTELIGPAVLSISLLAYNLAYYLPAQISYYRASNAENTDAANLVERAHVHHALVFVRSPQAGWVPYSRVFSYNSPWLDGDILYARDEGRRNFGLMKLYPGLSYYGLAGDRLAVLHKRSGTWLRRRKYVSDYVSPTVGLP